MSFIETRSRLFLTRLPIAAVSLAALPTLAGIVGILVLDDFVWRTTRHLPDHLALAPLFVLACCAAAGFVRYPCELAPIRRVLCGLAVVMALYGLALGATLSLAADTEALAWFTLTRYLLIPAAVLSFWRPAFAAAPMVYVALHKEATRFLGGANELGVNDYLPLVEIGLFLAIACTIYALLRRTIAVSVREGAVNAAVVTLLYVAIAAHFGNYLMSGFAKLALDGGLWSWALENPTSALMLNGYNLGAAPLSAFPGLFHVVYSGFERVEVASNIITLFAQVTCVFAFLHRRLLIAYTAFFDVMHVSIFVLTGALFLPWILLNTLLILALCRMPAPKFPMAAVAVGVVATLFAHLVFYNATLGWYDSRQARVGRFIVETVDGREVSVPATFYRDVTCPQSFIHPRLES